MKIIIVDDNVLVLKQLSKHLQQRGHQVIEFSNAMDALSNILKHQPDLIITDLLMPYISGNELYNALNQVTNYKPRILFITSLQEKHLQGMKEVDINKNILMKPLNFTQLDEKILKIAS